MSTDVHSTIQQRKKSFGTKKVADTTTVKSVARTSEGGEFDKPIHIVQDSLFSSTSGYTNYVGFFNLAIILLVVSNARVALENIIKYGILANPFHLVTAYLAEPYHWPILSLFALLHVFSFITYIIEWGLAVRRIPLRLGVLMHVLNLSTMLIMPVIVISLMVPHPIRSCLCLLTYSILFCKLISYAHVNHWCRKARYMEMKHKGHVVEEGRRGVVTYPNNLTISDLYYFICAPTLCYELNFPRTPKIRKWFVVKRLIESLFIPQIIVALHQQWTVPLIKNSMNPLVNMQWGQMVERMLKLAIPNHIIWLINFYCIFHSMCNLSAELLRFGDREFYRDWWNSETVQYFWQSWNIPVHRWCLRHLYKPIVHSGFSKSAASVAVFCVSAFFHEYLVSVPLHMFRLWAFWGMLLQIPLNYITTNILKGGRVGNVLVWLSLILGQPLAALMYVHDWYIMHMDS